MPFSHSSNRVEVALLKFLCTGDNRFTTLGKMSPRLGEMSGALVDDTDSLCFLMFVVLSHES